MSDEKRLREILRKLSVNDALWLIEQSKKVERYEQFLSACRYAGEDELPLLRKEANRILSNVEDVDYTMNWMDRVIEHLDEHLDLKNYPNRFPIVIMLVVVIIFNIIWFAFDPLGLK